jgi:hypothetical protein
VPAGKNGEDELAVTPRVPLYAKMGFVPTNEMRLEGL